MIKKIVCSAIACLSVWLVQAQLQPSDVKKFTLKNGMKFLVVPDATIPNANMYLFYKVGSRNEHQGITGLSHFFEHMMFNGAKKYGPKMFDRTMEFFGGSNNAYTTENVTVYTNWFPASSLETIFDLEADRISSLTIAPNMVESERGVVISERSTGIENSPWNELLTHMNATAFQEHPYHWPVIGYLDDMKHWTQADLEKYFKTYYAPNNCVVVITGSVQFDKVKQMATQYFEKIPAQPAPPKVNIVEPKQVGERRFKVQRNEPNAYMAMAFKAPEATHKDYYALCLLRDILATGKSSRLYKALIDSSQAAAEVMAMYDMSFDPTLFTLAAITSKADNDAAVEKIMLQQINLIKKNGVTAYELQTVKNQAAMQFYNQTNTINGVSNNLGTYELFMGDYKKMFDATEQFNKVSLQDIQRVANTYLISSAATVGVLKAKVD